MDTTVQSRMNNDDADASGDWANASSSSTHSVCSSISQTDCLMPTIAKRLDISVPIYGYISAPVITLTIVTNSLICLVLLRRGMRTATNLLLAAMALSDMLTGTAIPYSLFIPHFLFRPGNPLILNIIQITSRRTV